MKYEVCFTSEKSREEIRNEMLDKGIKSFRVKPIQELRTEKQNRALHLLFTQLADALNDKGITAQQIFSKPVEHFWTPELIKEVWRKIQYAMFRKRSTTQLKKQEEIDKIYDVFNKMITERTQGEVQCPPFPSLEELSFQQYER